MCLDSDPSDLILFLVGIVQLVLLLRGWSFILESPLWLVANIIMVIQQKQDNNLYYILGESVYWTSDTDHPVRGGAGTTSLSSNKII